MLTPDQVSSARAQFGITPVSPTNNNMTRSQAFTQSLNAPVGGVTPPTSTTPTTTTDPGYHDYLGAVTSFAGGVSTGLQNARTKMGDVAERALSGKQGARTDILQALGVGAGV